MTITAYPALPDRRVPIVRGCLSFLADDLVGSASTAIPVCAGKAPLTKKPPNLPEPEQAARVFRCQLGELIAGFGQFVGSHSARRKAAVQDRVNRFPAPPRGLSRDQDAVVAKALHQRPNDLDG